LANDLAHDPPASIQTRQHLPIAVTRRKVEVSLRLTADVITRIVNRHPQSRRDDLLPWAYPAMPQLNAVA